MKYKNETYAPKIFYSNHGSQIKGTLITLSNGSNYMRPKLSNINIEVVVAVKAQWDQIGNGTQVSK